MIVPSGGAGGAVKCAAALDTCIGKVDLVAMRGKGGDFSGVVCRFGVQRTHRGMITSQFGRSIGLPKVYRIRTAREKRATHGGCPTCFASFQVIESAWPRLV